MERQTENRCLKSPKHQEESTVGLNLSVGDNTIQMLNRSQFSSHGPTEDLQQINLFIWTLNVFVFFSQRDMRTTKCFRGEKIDNRPKQYWCVQTCSNGQSYVLNILFSGFVFLELAAWYTFAGKVISANI